MLNLDSLFKNNGSKEFVGVSLNVNGLLEVALTSRLNNSIVKYTNRFVNYNPITREVESYDLLRNELESALEELNLDPKKCNITLSLPNVLFGVTQLPVSLSPDETNSALIAQAEESYIFKREEAVVSWQKIKEINSNDVAMQKLVYSALQGSAVRETRRIFTELGANLISIQNSYSALFQGLGFAKIAENVNKGEKKVWDVLLISSTSYSIFSFEGDILIDYYEEPLAVKSFTSEEVYSAISAMVSSSLKNYPAENLLVISETNEVSAEVISAKLGFLTSVPFYIEQNQFQQNPPIEVDLNVLPSFVPQITILAIGAAVDHFENSFFKFNYLIAIDGSSSYEVSDFITIGDRTYELTKEKADKIVAVVVAVILVFFGILFLVLSSYNKSIDSEIVSLRSNESKLQKELNEYRSAGKTNVVNISSTIDNLLKSNRQKMLYYDALSYGIPDKLWIEHFYAGQNGSIGIHGVALESSDIAVFLRGIRDVVGESNVSVTKLTLSGEDDVMGSGTELYSFELSSSSYKNNLSQEIGTSSTVKKTTGKIPPAKGKSSLPPIIQ